MLNQYFGRAVPVLLANGGTVVQFVGDAVMVLFNAPARQPDHALRAARAALGMQAAIEEVAEREPDWPRFRVGINTGPALIGNIGSDEFRNFTAIGDTVNLAARLEQEVAEAGQVVLGPTTQAAIKHLAIARPLDPIEVKGKRDPVACWVLEGLKDDPTTWATRSDPAPTPRRLGPSEPSAKPTPPDLDERSCFIAPMSKGTATRQAVLDEAARVASRVGLSGLTIGSLAASTQLSKSGLFAHFQSKESLQLQLLDHTRARFIDLVVRPALAAPAASPGCASCSGAGSPGTPRPCPAAACSSPPAPSSTPSQAPCATGWPRTSATGWTRSPRCSAPASPRATSAPTPTPPSSPTTCTGRCWPTTTPAGCSTTPTRRPRHPRLRGAGAAARPASSRPAD